MNATIIALGSRASGSADSNPNPVPLPDVFQTQAAVSLSTTAATVWSATAGRRIRLLGGSVSLSAADVLIFQDSAANVAFRSPKLLADTPYTFDLGFGAVLASGEPLNIKTVSGAATMNGTLWGIWD